MNTAQKDVKDYTLKREVMRADDTIFMNTILLSNKTATALNLTEKFSREIIKNKIKKNRVKLTKQESHLDGQREAGMLYIFEKACRKYLLEVFNSSRENDLSRKYTDVVWLSDSVYFDGVDLLGDIA